MAIRKRDYAKEWQSRLEKEKLDFCASINGWIDAVQIANRNSVGMVYRLKI